jgi:GT2 family glycosyltransferase/O-antigen/teichoic acid export membrane protein
VALFRGLEKMPLVSVILVLQRVLFLMLGLIVFLAGWDVVAFARTFLLVSILILIICHLQLRAMLPASSEKIDKARIREIFFAALPICGVVLFTYIYFRVDSVLIFFLRGEEETGWYSAGFKLLEAMGLLLASIRGALFPILSRTFSDRNEGYQKIWRGGVRYLFLIGFPVTIAVILLAPQIVLLLFGPSYQPAIPVFQVMVVGFSCLCLNDFASFFLVSRDQTNRVIRVVSFAAIFNMLINFMVIPIWGMLGAAVIASTTGLFVFYFYFRAIRAMGVKVRIVPLIWRPIIASAGMALTFWFMEHLPLAVLIGIMGLSYFIILNLLQTFDEYDYLVMRSIFKFKGSSVPSELLSLPPMSLDLSIITVNYKSTDHLMKCLESIADSVGNLSYEVIVIDNNSQDDCAERVSSQFPEAIFIANDENVGFSRANNQGIKVSKGKYILLLNNDTVVQRESLAKMHSIMERSPEIGLLGCRLVNADGSMQHSFGRMLSIVNEFGRKYIINPLLRHHKNPTIKKITDSLFSHEQEADWICGACMFLRRKALQEVRLLDEKIFLYMEDVDLGVRIKRAGWEVKYTPEATVIHFGGGSVPQNQFRTLVEYRRSQLYFYKKHYGQLGLLPLKVYLYMKMGKNFLMTFVDRLLTLKKPEELEERDRFNREIFSIIRNYR